MTYIVCFLLETWQKMYDAVPDTCVAELVLKAGDFLNIKYKHF